MGPTFKGQDNLKNNNENELSNLSDVSNCITSSLANISINEFNVKCEQTAAIAS